MRPGGATYRPHSQPLIRIPGFERLSRFFAAVSRDPSSRFPSLHLLHQVSQFQFTGSTRSLPIFRCFFPRAFPSEIESSRAAEKNGSSGRAEKPFLVPLCVCMCGFAHMVRCSIFEEFQSSNRMRLFFRAKIRSICICRGWKISWFYSRDISSM